MHPSVHCRAVYNSQDMEATKMSIDRRTDKEKVVPVNSRIILSHQKNETMPLAVAWMHLEMVTLSEVNQTDKSPMIPLACGI